MAQIISPGGVARVATTLIYEVKLYFRVSWKLIKIITFIVLYSR